nr:hypothetical protein [uncultured Cohaesibacter sp.]
MVSRVIAFLSALLMMATLSSSAPAQSSSDLDRIQQQTDQLVQQLGAYLQKSISAPSWGAYYREGGRTILNLQGYVDRGGQLRSNPVAKAKSDLEALLDQRRRELQALIDAQAKMERIRSKWSRQAAGDIVGEMVQHMNPIPGWGTPVKLAANKKNREMIVTDFRYAKNAGDHLKLLDKYVRNLQPSIHELNARIRDLAPLEKAFASLKRKVGFDGHYQGSLGGGASGIFQFTVQGNSLRGGLTGSYKGDRVQGVVTGTVSQDGWINCQVSGRIHFLSKDAFIPSWDYKGELSGQLSSSSAKGQWKAGSGDEWPSGSWSASRQ